MKEQLNFDVLILGGGIAGMTAAIYGARANLRCAIIETNITGGLVNSTYTVENVPSYREIHGMELMAKVRAHVDAFNVPVEEVAAIESLELLGQEKTITTDEAVYKAGAVILATGREPVPLPVDQECDQVHYCAICDGPGYVGKRVLVVGGGNSAFDEGLYLMGIGIEHLTLIEIMPRFFAAAATQEKLSCHGSDKVSLNTQTRIERLLINDGALTGVVLCDADGKNGRTIACDGIFCFLGQRPNTTMFKDVVALDDIGYILADTLMRTNIPGVFAAGDVTQKKYRQITTAMGDGTVAILEAEHYLRSR